MEENRLQIIVINLKMYIAILLNMTREKFKEKKFFFCIFKLKTWMRDNTEKVATRHFLPWFSGTQKFY